MTLFIKYRINVTVNDRNRSQLFSLINYSLDLSTPKQLYGTTSLNTVLFEISTLIYEFSEASADVSTKILHIFDQVKFQSTYTRVYYVSLH